MKSRAMERALRDEYLASMESLCERLNASNLDGVIAVAELPSAVRGYGPVKEQAMAQYAIKRAALLESISTAGDMQRAA